MISPHTPPGTKVICVENYPRPEIMPNIEIGKVYTIAEMVLCKYSGQVGVFLVETPELHQPVWAIVRDIGPRLIRRVFQRSQFRYLDLPKSITDCLNVEKIPAAVKREVATEHAA